MNKKFHLLKLVACIMSSVCIMQCSTLWSMESDSKPISEAYSEAYSQALKDTKSDEVLSLEELILDSKAVQSSYCLSDMGSLATTRKSIYKAVIDLRDSINEEKKKGQYQNLQNPKQRKTKQKLFKEALKKFCEFRDSEDIYSAISVIFYQLSLILNNKTQNTDEVIYQLKDDYQLNYLLCNIKSNDENDLISGEDMVIDVLNWFMRCWLDSKQSPTEFLNEISKSNSDSEKAYYVTPYSNTFIYDEYLNKNDALRKLVGMLEIDVKDGERIKELNEAIVNTIHIVRDNNLLETLDALMSLIMKASKNIKIESEAPKEENNSKNGSEDEAEKEQNINNEKENEDKNSNAGEDKQEEEEIEVEEEEKKSDE